MIVNTNVAAMQADRSFNTVENALQSSMEKLSSGFRINHASDDAAGLGIANTLQADAAALTQASRNAQQATSMLQVSEGATNTISNILQRMKELATQAGSDSVDDTGRGQIKAEWDQLVSEIDATANTTKFQGSTLINGGFGNSVDTSATNSTALAAGTGVYAASINGAAADTYTLASTTANPGELTLTNSKGVSQTVAVAANGKQTVSFDNFGITLQLDTNFTTSTGSAAGSADATTVKVTAGTSGGSFLVRSSGDYTGADLVSVSNVDLRASTLGVDSGSISLTGNGTATQWQTAITNVDTAIQDVNNALGTIGAAQNRINYALSNAQTEADNFTAAESTIKDVDMASEMTTFSSNQILAQAGEAMLAQANQNAQGVVRLIQAG
jgi:flagellin